MKFCFVACFLLLCPLLVPAQDKGNVTVHSDSRLAILLGKTKNTEASDDDDDDAPLKNKSVKGREKTEKASAKAKYLYDPESEGDKIASDLGRVRKERELASRASATAVDERTTGKTARENSAAKEKEIELPALKEKTTKVPKAAKYYLSESRGGAFAGQGFRVQIYYGTNRYEALRRKSEFMRHHPDVRTYFVYISPNYRVKVGDYRRREDAAGMFREANGFYNACMIVPDNIKIK